MKLIHRFAKQHGNGKFLIGIFLAIFLALAGCNGEPLASQEDGGN
jgi:hypothetical protein